MTFEALPEKALRTVYSYLDNNSYLSSRLVCRQWNHSSNNASAWNGRLFMPNPQNENPPEFARFIAPESSNDRLKGRTITAEEAASSGSLLGTYLLVSRQMDPERADYETSEEWYRAKEDAELDMEALAKAGCSAAQFEHGRILEENSNHKDAFKWYKRAALQGHKIAAELVADWYFDCYAVKTDPQKGAHWMQRAAEWGNARAANKIAFCYYNGNGVAHNLNKALEWWEKGAILGNADAQNTLADCLYNGEGIDKDIDKAARLWEKAAQRGHLLAMTSLGVYHYSLGELNKAINLWQKAAEKSNNIHAADGAFYLAECYERGEGVEKDPIRALELLMKAANLCSPFAQYDLGVRYKLGDGVQQNFTLAQEWLQKASDEGHVDAKALLNDFPQAPLPRPHVLTFRDAQKMYNAPCSKERILHKEITPEEKLRYAKARKVLVQQDPKPQIISRPLQQIPVVKSEPSRFQKMLQAISQVASSIFSSSTNFIGYVLEETYDFFEDIYWQIRAGLKL